MRVIAGTEIVCKKADNPRCTAVHLLGRSKWEQKRTVWIIFTRRARRSHGDLPRATYGS